MKTRVLWALFLCLSIAGCSQDNSQEQQAERMLVTARDLEEELDTLPKAIARYAEIVAQYPQTEAGKKASKRQDQLTQVQRLLAEPRPEAQDSLTAYYKEAIQVAPNYFALLKKLGTIYYNQTLLGAPAAVKTRFAEMKDGVVEVWEKQDALWQNYDFRPLPSERTWKDNLCKQAIVVSEMLIAPIYSEYDRAYGVIQRGLAYGNSEDVLSKAKVVGAFCSFRQGKPEDLKNGIALAKDALKYEFLSDEDQARAYHVIGLCYTYLHQDSGEMADLDAAIKALNECVNIDSGMADARDLLKTLRQMRDKLPS